jgi:hypothetical protein
VKTESHLATLLVALPSIGHLIERLVDAERERLAIAVAIRHEVDRVRRQAGDDSHLETVAAAAAAELRSFIDDASDTLNRATALVEIRKHYLRMERAA